MDNMDVHFSSEKDTWETPQDFYDRLDKEFGFTLDPCCLESSAKCETFFTPEEDGLRQEWAGHTVFMNPPYGKEIGDWMRYAAEQSVEYGITVVCLIPMRSCSQWFHRTVIDYHANVRLVEGRLKFGGSKTSAPFPSAVAIFAPWAKGKFTTMKNKEE
jgi:phage N-6-adenine-methyltransferase